MDKEKQRDALVEYVKTMQLQEALKQQQLQQQQQQFQQANDAVSSTQAFHNASCFSNLLVNLIFFFTRSI